MLPDRPPPPLRVDYDSHPGFSAFSHGKGGNFEAQLADFREIDSAFQRLNQDGQVRSQEQLEAYAAEHLVGPIKRLFGLLSQHLNEKDLYRPIATEALEDFGRVLVREATFRNQGKRHRTRSRGAQHDEMVQSLTEKGFTFRPLSQPLLQQLWTELAPWRKSLEERRRRDRPKTIASCAVPLPLEGPIWNLLNRMLVKAGLPAAIDDFNRHPMELAYASLQLSHDDEAWWKGCYADVGLPDAKLTYLHFDEDFDLIKAIVYLQPVRENGPFSLVPNSSVYTPSYARDVFIKRLDVHTEAAYQSVPGVFDFPYVRKQFKLPNFREGFLKLPEVMRGSIGIGDDILDETALGRWLLDHEIKVTSDVSNCVVFSGGHLLHRGGMVHEGERWAIQLGFKLRNRYPSAWPSRMKNAIKRRLPTALRKRARTPKPL